MINLGREEEVGRPDPDKHVFPPCPPPSFPKAGRATRNDVLFGVSRNVRGKVCAYIDLGQRRPLLASSVHLCRMRKIYTGREYALKICT